MSYSLVPYMIDLADLRGAVGSGNRKLIEAIRDKYPEAFNGVYDDSGDDEDVTLGEALEQLVNGGPMPRGSTGAYGEALRGLAAHFGARREARAWAGIKLCALDEAGVDGFTGNGPPVALPDPNGDFPIIGHLTRETIRELLANPGRLPKPHSHREREQKVLTELTTEFEGWLRTAASHDKDLLFFCA